MALIIFYVFAILCIVLYYTGHLKRFNCEWVLLVLAAAVAGEFARCAFERKGFAPPVSGKVGV